MELEHTSPLSSEEKVKMLIAPVIHDWGEIIIDGEKSDKYYYGVLHSMTDLNKSIIDNGFSTANFEELNFLDNKGFEPIYNAYLLRKNATNLHW